MRLREEMKEISWLGRGGQGAFTASRLLGVMGMLSGSYALAFPSFGPERRGAPIRAYTKLSEKPIVDRSVITQNDYIMILDDSLYQESVLKELKPNGRILINTADRSLYHRDSIVAANVTVMAEKILGRPIVNTAMLGVLLAVDDSYSIHDITQAIEQYMPSRIAPKNIELVKHVYESVKSEQM